jgi:hypothetical protein
MEVWNHLVPRWFGEPTNETTSSAMNMLPTTVAWSPESKTHDA